MAPAVSNSKTNNRLLNLLPSEVLASILPRMVAVEHKQYHVLAKADQRISSVYFPVSGWVSMVAQLANGRLAEVGVAGSEGMVGLPIVLGSDQTFVEWMVQSSGVLLKLDVPSFRQALEDHPAMRSLLLRYALAFQDQVAQTAACNVSHTIDQRLARWLLLALDRNGGNALSMTQDLLGMMLGVRRAGVTTAAGALQKAGLISYSHGVVSLLDRAGLEAYSCECYAAVQRRFNQLLAPD